LASLRNRKEMLVGNAVESLLKSNLLEVFGERDPKKRRAAMERIYTPDVEFADPDGLLIGLDAIDSKVAALLQSAPEFVFSASGPVYRVHDMTFLAWGLGPDGGDPIVRGADAGFVRDGRIARLYTIIFE
jgi:hypothetical protein